MRFSRSKTHFSSSTLLPSRHIQNHSRSRSSSLSARVGEFSQMSSYTTAAEWTTVSNGSSNCSETDLILPSFKLHSTRSISALLARLHHRQCHAHRCLEKFSLFSRSNRVWHTTHNTLGSAHWKMRCYQIETTLSFPLGLLNKHWWNFPVSSVYIPSRRTLSTHRLYRFSLKKKVGKRRSAVPHSNFSRLPNYRIYGIYFVMREQHRSN